MTLDWSAQAEPVPYAQLDNPQSLDLYSYVLNNPVTHADADGHCLEDACIVETALVLYAASAVTSAVDSYLASPAGRQAERAAGQLVTSSIQALSNAVTQQDAAAKGAQPPLVGNNPKESKNRTNIDLPGGHDEAKAKFDELTKGQGRRVEPGTGHTVADDTTRLRLNPDGTARIDMPKQGVPKPETIHFNPKPAVAICNGGGRKPCQS